MNWGLLLQRNWHLVCLGFLYLTNAAYQYFRVWHCLLECREQQDMAEAIAVCFVTLALPISLFHSFEHWNHFVRPQMQTQVVRIIWMIPVFSMESYLCIALPALRFYFQSLRECYEAFVLYSFTRLLLHYLGDEAQLEMLLIRALPSTVVTHTVPFCWLRPWNLDGEFIRSCKTGVFQFVVVRVLLALVAVPLHWASVVDVRSLAPDHVHTWITLVTVCSQSYALYCLYMLYHVTKRELAPVRSLSKFMCIKVVIFLSWWQSLIVGYLVHTNRLTPHRHNYHPTAEARAAVAAQIGSLIICMEMLLAAVAFALSFPVSDFRGGALGASLADRQKEQQRWLRGMSPSVSRESLTALELEEETGTGVVEGVGKGSADPLLSPQDEFEFSTAAAPAQSSVLLFGVFPLMVRRGSQNSSSSSAASVWIALYKFLIGVPNYVKQTDLSAREARAAARRSRERRRQGSLENQSSLVAGVGAEVGVLVGSAVDDRATASLANRRHAQIATGHEVEGRNASSPRGGSSAACSSPLGTRSKPSDGRSPKPPLSPSFRSSAEAKARAPGGSEYEGSDDEDDCDTRSNVSGRSGDSGVRLHYFRPKRGFGYNDRGRSGTEDNVSGEEDDDDEEDEEEYAGSASLLGFIHNITRPTVPRKHRRRGAVSSRSTRGTKATNLPVEHDHNQGFNQGTGQHPDPEGAHRADASALRESDIETGRVVRRHSYTYGSGADVGTEDGGLVWGGASDGGQIREGAFSTGGGDIAGARRDTGAAAGVGVLSAIVMSSIPRELSQDVYGLGAELYSTLGLGAMFRREQMEAPAIHA